jgi:hypothetical protein
MQLPLRYPPPVTRSGLADWSGPARTAAIALFAASATLALLAPFWFWLPLATAAAIGVAVLAFRHTVVFCVAWLLIAGATLEMTLNDLFGPGAFQTTRVPDHDRSGQGSRTGARRHLHTSLRP